MDAIEHPPLVSLFHQGIPDHVLYTWVVMGVLIVLSLAASRNLQLAPRGVQNFMEMVLGQFPGLMAPTSNLNTTAACALIVFATYHVIGIRKQGFLTYLKHFCGPVPLLAPLMFPIELVSHLARPLSLSLRLFGNMFGGHVLLAIIFLLTGLDGLIGWALTGKLAGLLIGVPGGAIMIAFTVGFLLPLKILVAFLQAFIFCMLSMLYIAGAIEEAEHH